MELNIEDRARLLIRDNRISVDPLDHGTYLDMVRRCGLVLETVAIIEHNEEGTIE